MAITNLFKKKRKLNLTVNDLKDVNKIRLYYIALEKFQRTGDILTTRIGQTFGISSPFKIPEGMSLKDACKVISFLSVKIEKEYNLEPASEKSVAAVSKILESFGFEKIDGYDHGHIHTVLTLDNPFKRIKTTVEQCCGKIDGVADLFTINADFKLFQRTDLYDRYFEWFTYNRYADEIKEIYKKIGKEDLVKDLTNNPSRACMTERHLPNGEIEVSASLVDCGKIVIGEEKTK